MLELPDGFHYIRFGDEGSPMDGGAPTPPSHDGMAAFSGGPGIIRLVRNHEVVDKGQAFARPAYDPVATGGTTTMVFDSRARRVRTPPRWPGPSATTPAARRRGLVAHLRRGHGRPRSGFERLHGIRLRGAGADSPADPFPLRAMGRFVHEAVAVDPTSGIVYLTEDRPTGFYRFIPNKPGALRLGGKLQMLAVDGHPAYDTRDGQPGGVTVPVGWVDIEDSDPPNAGWNPLSVFHQGLSLGGATFGRLEGCCFFDNGRVLINSTAGGDGCGQVWEYQPQPDGPGGSASSSNHRRRSSSGCPTT